MWMSYVLWLLGALWELITPEAKESHNWKTKRNETTAKKLAAKTIWYGNKIREENHKSLLVHSNQKRKEKQHTWNNWTRLCVQRYRKRNWQADITHCRKCQRYRFYSKTMGCCPPVRPTPTFYSERFMKKETDFCCFRHDLVLSSLHFTNTTTTTNTSSAHIVHAHFEEEEKT